MHHQVGQSPQFRNDDLQPSHWPTFDVTLASLSDYFAVWLRLSSANVDAISHQKFPGSKINQEQEVLSIAAGNHAPGGVGFAVGIPRFFDLIERQENVDFGGFLWVSRIERFNGFNLFLVKFNAKISQVSAWGIGVFFSTFADVPNLRER